MPLFELEEGPHHKFYRIDRVGARLELHWGRIGTAGQKKTLELASESEAVHELEQEIFRRRERGYRQVVDESAPHDHEEARQRALAATGALTKYPRFVFRKRDQVTWLEVRDAVLVTASGHAGAIPTPVERACDSEQAALRERDRMMAELVGAGYALDEFGAAETPAAKRRGPKLGALRSHPELEAQLAASPDDPSTWLVFEDWLLDQRDPRASLIEHERSGDVTSAAQARGTLKRLLLGPRAATFEHAISSATWRAGFLRACHFDASNRRGENQLALLLASPAARFLTRLELDVAGFAVLEQLHAAPLVRALTVRRGHGGGTDTIMDAAHLEPLAHLTELALYDVGRLEPAPCLARVRQLELAFCSMFGYAGLAAMPLHEVVRFVLALDGNIGMYVGETPNKDLAWSSALPVVRDLELSFAGSQLGASLAAAANFALATKLVPQLRRLRITQDGRCRVLTAAERATYRGGAFAHLEHVELPDDAVT